MKRYVYSVEIVIDDSNKHVSTAKEDFVGYMEDAVMMWQLQLPLNMQVIQEVKVS